MEDLTKEEEVVLVDEENQVLGYMGKLEAHKKALLHRAISVIETRLAVTEPGGFLIRVNAYC